MKRAALIASVFLLAGCEDKPAPPAEQGGEAAGEVLGGTISDEMIPLEQLRSKSPPLPRRTAAADSPAQEGEAGEEAAPDSEGAETAPAAPAPETAAPAAE